MWYNFSTSVPGWTKIEGYNLRLYLGEVLRPKQHEKSLFHLKMTILMTLHGDVSMPPLRDL